MKLYKIGNNCEMVYSELNPKTIKTNIFSTNKFLQKGLSQSKSTEVQISPNINDIYKEFSPFKAIKNCWSELFKWKRNFQ